MAAISASVFTYSPFDVIINIQFFVNNHKIQLLVANRLLINYLSIETFIVFPCLLYIANTTLLAFQTLFLFFSKICASKLGVRLIYGCGLYMDIYVLNTVTEVFIVCKKVHYLPSIYHTLHLSTSQGPTQISQKKSTLLCQK